MATEIKFCDFLQVHSLIFFLANEFRKFGVTCVVIGSFQTDTGTDTLRHVTVQETHFSSKNIFFLNLYGSVLNRTIRKLLTIKYSDSDMNVQICTHVRICIRFLLTYDIELGQSGKLPWHFFTK